MDKVVALSIGADDYMVKPFSPSAMTRSSMSTSGTCAATRRRPHVGVRVEVAEHAVALTVSDAGPGFALPAPEREGTRGLGLPLVIRLVEDMGGRIALPVGHYQVTMALIRADG